MNTSLLRPCSADPVKRVGAFTLVELLVVITIIGLLIAILLPSLGKAKEATWQAGCLANLRQAMIAMACYANDYNRAAPPNCHNPDAASLDPAVASPNYYTVRLNPPWNTTEGLNATHNLRTDYPGATYTGFTYSGMGLMIALDYVPFTKDGGKIFYCPAERKNGFTYYQATSYSMNPWGYYFNAYSLATRRWIAQPFGADSCTASYLYNPGRDGRPDRFYSLPNSGQRSLSIDDRARFVAMVDECSNMLGTTTSQGTVWWKDPHGNGVYKGFNRAWFDGHAKWYSDPNKIWVAAVPSNDTYYGNGYSSWVDVWHLWDAD